MIEKAKVALRAFTVAVYLLVAAPHMAMAEPPFPGLQLTFHDEFRGGLRSEVWTPVEFNDRSPNGRSMPGELELYVDPSFRGTAQRPLGLAPAHITDGHLDITAIPTPKDVMPFVWGYKYLSGKITTARSFSQSYGYFEVRAKMPKGNGFWPAAWLLPSTGAWPPEIDLFEILGQDTNGLVTTVHWSANGKHTQDALRTQTPDLSAGFHTYGMRWDEKFIVFYLDGQEVHRVPTPDSLHQPCYLIINLAIGGGGWVKRPDASTPFPGTLSVEWVRVYKFTGNATGR
jgi:serralysin